MSGIAVDSIDTPPRPLRTRRRPRRPVPPAFTVVVPCFNEESGVGPMLDALERALVDAGAYEVILVDDGSTDRTAELLAERASRDPRLRVVSHSRNRGYGAALKTGLRGSRSELVVITDADGTYPVDQIPALLAAAENADMVVGARDVANGEYPWLRRLPKAILTTFTSWMVGERIPDINSGLRVFRRALVERYLAILPDGFSFTTTITVALLTNRYDVRYLPITPRRRFGRSKIRPIFDTLNFLHLIFRTAVYFAPLRAFSPIILLLALAFLASAAYDVFVIENLTDKTVILLLFVINSGMFAVLADMIDKRSDR